MGTRPAVRGRDAGAAPGLERPHLQGVACCHSFQGALLESSRLNVSRRHPLPAIGACVLLPQTECRSILTKHSSRTAAATPTAKPATFLFLLHNVTGRRLILTGDSARFHHATPNGVQCKTYKLCISGIFFFLVFIY